MVINKYKLQHMKKLVLMVFLGWGLLVYGQIPPEKRIGGVHRPIKTKPVSYYINDRYAGERFFGNLHAIDSLVIDRGPESKRSRGNSESNLRFYTREKVEWITLPQLLEERLSEEQQKYILFININESLIFGDYSQLTVDPRLIHSVDAYSDKDGKKLTEVFIKMEETGKFDFVKDVPTIRNWKQISSSERIEDPNRPIQKKQISYYINDRYAGNHFFGNLHAVDSLIIGRESKSTSDMGFGNSELVLRFYTREKVEWLILQQLLEERISKEEHKANGYTSPYVYLNGEPVLNEDYSQLTLDPRLILSFKYYSDPNRKEIPRVYIKMEETGKFDFVEDAPPIRVE